MAAQIIECEQSSPEWYAARRGIPTASEFSTVLAKGEGKTRKTYMMKLAGEIITEQSMDSYSNADMERGKVMEDEALQFYAFTRDVEVERVGFIRNGRAGASPDGLIGSKGAVEIKTALPHVLIESILRDEFPPAHKAQCQGVLWVGELDWIDIVVYWPGMTPFVCRAGRDEDYIKTLAQAVDDFNAELDKVVERVRAYGARAA